MAGNAINVCFIEWCAANPRLTCSMDCDRKVCTLGGMAPLLFLASRMAAIQYSSVGASRGFLTATVVLEDRDEPSAAVFFSSVRVGNSVAPTLQY